MVGQGRTRSLVAVGLVVGLLCPISAQGASRKVIRLRLAGRLAAIARKLTHVRHELRQTKQQQRSAWQDLRTIQDRIDALHGDASRIQARLAKTSAELAATRRRLRAAQIRLDRNTAILSARLRAAQRNPDPGFVSVLLGAGDMRDLISRKRVVQKIVEADVSLLQEIERDRAEVERQQAILEDRQRRQSELLHELHDRELQAKLAEQRQKDVIDRIEQDRQQLEAMLEQQERDSEQVRAMLQELSESPEGRARAAHPWSGLYFLPVRGRLTSRFGYRVHPILHVAKLHTGVDIACPSGTPIHASAGGVVVHAGWLGGYGKAVIIDHGGGVSTLYGHCSELLVSTGQSVTQGQVIARVGSTGFSTGPHLHFEKRLNGVPVNPIP